MGLRSSYSTRHSQVLYEASRPHSQCYIFQYSTSKTSAVKNSLNLLVEKRNEVLDVLSLNLRWERCFLVLWTSGKYRTWCGKKCAIYGKYITGCGKSVLYMENIELLVPLLLCHSAMKVYNYGWVLKYFQRYLYLSTFALAELLLVLIFFCSTYNLWF